MNFVYLKVDHLSHEKQNPVHLNLKSVQLLRDNEVIAELGDLNITRLPAYYFRAVPTGFSKIEIAMKNRSQFRIQCHAGYLRTGEYIVASPEGEITLPYNALSGLWTLNKPDGIFINHREFISRGYALIRPTRIFTRGLSTY